MAKESLLQNLYYEFEALVTQIEGTRQGARRDAMIRDALQLQETIRRLEV